MTMEDEQIYVNRVTVQNPRSARLANQIARRPRNHNGSRRVLTMKSLLCFMSVAHLVEHAVEADAHQVRKVLVLDHLERE
jgi:hypothetical protein